MSDDVGGVMEEFPVHYKDAVVWQRAMDVARRTYGLARTLPKEEVFAFRSQMTRAAVSVPCNIAEGWTRESRKEKAHFLAIAHGSAAELETLLILAIDIGWFSADHAAPLRQTLDEVSRMLTTLRRRVRLGQERGTRQEPRGVRNE